MAAVGEIHFYQRDQSGRVDVLLDLFPRVFFEKLCPKKTVSPAENRTHGFSFYQRSVQPTGPACYARTPGTGL